MQRTTALIMDVDITKRQAHVSTKRNSRLLVSYRSVDAAFQIPAVGERWIIERGISSHDWQLISRQDTPAEQTTKTGLSQGDTHLRSSGQVLVEATAINVKQKGSANTPKSIGAPFTDHTTTTGTSTTSWTLAETPVNNAILFFAGGSIISPGLVSVSGNVVTFPSQPAGTLLVAYYQILI